MPPLTTANMALVSEATTPDSSPPIWFEALMNTEVDGRDPSAEFVGDRRDWMVFGPHDHAGT